MKKENKLKLFESIGQEAYDDMLFDKDLTILVDKVLIQKFEFADFDILALNDVVDGINRFLKANNYSNIVNSVYCFALIKSNNELYNNIKNKLELTALQSLAQLVQNKNFRATELMLINTSNMFKNSANTTNLKLQINTSEVNFENMSIEELNEYEKRLLNITDVRENLVDTAYKRHKHIILEDELDEVYNKLNILNKIDDIELV